MTNFKIDKKFVNIILLNIFVYIAFSMVHPITPKLINETGLPTFYFGLLYGCTNISTFIASPTFGVICSMYGKKLPMIIGILGYTIGQIIFGFFTNHISALVARFISGLFLSGYFVSSISYVSSITENNQKLKRFAYLNASTSLGNALGSFLGGYIGVNDYKITFIVQIILCFASIIFISIFFKDTKTPVHNNKKLSFKVFSFKDFKKVAKSNNFVYLILILMVITFLGIQCYTSTISYYVEDILRLPTTINGLILGSTGLVTLVTNSFLIPVITKKISAKNLYLISLIVSGVSIVIAMLFNNQFILITFFLIFIISITVITPVMQSMIVQKSKNNYQEELFGLQNGFRSIGLFLGSVLSGLIFDIWFKLPFFISGISLILCFVIFIFYEKSQTKNG